VIVFPLQDVICHGHDSRNDVLGRGLGNGENIKGAFGKYFRTLGLIFETNGNGFLLIRWNRDDFSAEIK